MMFTRIGSWFGSHRRWEALIDAAVDGELTAAEQAALDRHLGGCDACAARLRDHRALKAALSTSIPSIQPSRSFALTPDMLREPVTPSAPSPSGGLARIGRGAVLAMQGGAAALLIAFGTLIAVDTLDGSGGSADDDTSVPASAEINTTMAESGAATDDSTSGGSAERSQEDEDGDNQGYAPSGELEDTPDLGSVADSAQTGSDGNLSEGGDSADAGTTQIAAPEPESESGRDWFGLATVVTGVGGVALAGLALVTSIARRRAQHREAQ